MGAFFSRQNSEKVEELPRPPRRAIFTAIERLLKITKKGTSEELCRFLSKEDGFRHVQTDHPGLSALHFVAGRQFQSSEEADEWFGYFIGQEIDERDRWRKRSPLHYACLHGSIFGVKWLVEHHAAIDSADTLGHTPFMFACASDVDRSLKVRFLDGKGVNCLAKDKDGQTALFHATNDSKSDDDIKDVLRYLVIEKSVDVNCVRMWGRTPLLHACAFLRPFVVIDQLISLGADVSARDSMNQNALHIASCNSQTDKSVISLFIEKGVDVTCEDKNGNTPHLLAYGEIRNLLRHHYDAVRFSVLQREKVRPDSIKLCVIGSEMAGKTTFVNSLLRLDLPPIDPKDRTAGIEIHSSQIPGVGKGLIWDFGAQSTFHSAHGLFFGSSNTIFVLVLRFRKAQAMTPEIGLLEIGRYWCAFVKAPLRALFSRPTSRLRLVVIFNLIGFGEEAGVEASFQAKRVAEILREEFRDTFEIFHVIEMDCSKSNSFRMNDCRNKLKRLREAVLKAADEVPKLCHAIEQNLCLPDEKRKFPLSCFMTADEFETWVAQDIGIALTPEEKKVSVEYLDSSGIIVDLGSRICSRPIWLCRNVVGPLLAPPYFPFGMPSGKSGEVSRRDIESALRAFENDLKKKGTLSSYTVTADEAIAVLLALDLCIRVEDSSELYQIPALLENSISRRSWEEDPIFDVYRGQRYECAHPVDIISPSSFVVFQSRCSRMAATSREAWKDGLKVVKIVGGKVVECLVDLGIKKGHCCIDLVVRWSRKSACNNVAKEFVTQLEDMIVRVCDERSPGVVLNWYYLDSKHLKRLDEDPAIYSMSDVRRKLREKDFDHVLFSVQRRTEKRHHSSVRDLVIMDESDEKGAVSYANGTVSICSTVENTAPCCGRVPQPFAIAPLDEVAASSTISAFPADDELVSLDLLRACAAVKGSKWEDIGVFLIGSEDLDDIRRAYGGNVVRMFKVLESWNMAKSPSVGQLLAWFEEVGVNRYHIERKYNELYASK